MLQGFWKSTLREVNLAKSPREIFGLDLRSLGLFRIALAIILILDILLRFSNLRAHYSDQGVFPREFFFENLDRFYYHSIFFATGNTLLLSFIFGFFLLVAVLLLLGYRTRLMTFLAWIFILSVHARNPAVLQGGDVELRLLFFWSLFLPLGARFSIDSVFFEKDSKPRSQSYLSFGSVAFLIQIFLIYFTAALIKNSPEWQQEGSAIYYALHLDVFTTHIGKYLLQFEQLLQPMTISVWYLELLGMFLFFIPGLQFVLRPIGILLFCSLHFGFFLTMELGLFPWISILPFIALIPAGIWNRFKLKNSGPITIYYDPDCGFCKKACLLIANCLGYSSDQVKPANINSEILSLMEKHNSWILQAPDGSIYHSYTAFVHLIEASPRRGRWSILFSNSFARKIGEKLYRIVANRRQLFSILTRPIKFKKYRSPDDGFSVAFVTISIACVIWWNVERVRIETKLPSIVRDYVLSLRLDQYWNMFAPYPLKDDGWYILDAQLLDETRIDVLPWLFGKEARDVSFEKPLHVADEFPSQRWRKYFLNLQEREGKDYSEGLARYICRQWNRTHFDEKRMQRVELIKMKEPTLLKAQSFPVKKQRIWRFICIKEESKASE